MDLSIYVARVVSVIYLAVGLGMLFDKAYYKKMMNDIFKDMAAIYLGGFMALFAGFTLVSFHNEWVKSWEVLITIIGWLALIKGVMLLAFPSSFLKFTKSWFKPKNLGTWGLAVIVLGLLFGYFGFVV